MIFFERVSGTIVCRRRRLVWQFSTGDLVLSTPTVDEASGTCFVGSVDRRMYALDLARYGFSTATFLLERLKSLLLFYSKAVVLPWQHLFSCVGAFVGSVGDGHGHNSQQAPLTRPAFGAAESSAGT